jgi:predicted nucleotidyltransferase
MINFFRRIRQQLFSESKLSKYLFYAIGEILLVVIGILIALQINNWNENRIKSNKEANVLANIHKEFKNNKIQLDKVLKRHKTVHSNCAKIIALFPIKEKPEPEILDSLSVYLFGSYEAYTFNPSQSSIDALINTSSFDIIKDEELRNLLIAWNDLVEDYQEEEKNSSDYVWLHYDPFLSKHFDWNMNFNDPRVNFEALQTLEFEYIVKNRFDFVNEILVSSGELKILQETLDKIIELSKPSNN